MAKKLLKAGNINERMDIALNKFRSRMTSCPPGICPLVMYRSVLQLSMNQSCGKCVPCREGLYEADRLLGDILKGVGSEATIEKLSNLCKLISESADCAIGVVAANTILDSLKDFADEYESHIKNKKCISEVEQGVPCSSLCPAHVDVPGYISLIAEEDYAGAVNIIRDSNPFPTACAYVCEHPCENKCRRSIIDAPINIRALKKYAVDNIPADKVDIPKKNENTGKTIAVVGAGPSGLTAAYFLALMGHNIVVFDEHEKPGGMLRYGIPEYRLPKEKLDEDIRAILYNDNISLKTNTKIGKDITIGELRKNYDAVYIAIGAAIGNRMKVDNAYCKNVISAAEFLQKVSKGESIDLSDKRVVLIGGGNVAMDAARTAIRLGALTVHVFTRSRDDYTALKTEIESAMQEGVRFRTLLNFLNIEESKDNPDEVCAVWLQPQIVGEYDEKGLVTTEHSSAYPYRFLCDYLIMGVGQSPDTEAFKNEGISIKAGKVDADEYCMVRQSDGVFSGGDCVTGPSTAINAIAAGQVAAYNIDEYLGYHHKVRLEATKAKAFPNSCIPTGRAEIEERDPFERRKDFKHVEIKMTPEEAKREAGRCLRCDFFGCVSKENK